MRLLITGGTGFVGGAVIAEATRRGMAVDLLTRGPAKRALLGVGTLDMGSGRWSTRALSGALERAAPDVVLHLAGGPGHGTIEELYEANVFLCHRLIAAARETAPAARIVVIGSAAEYGPPASADGRAREDDPARPAGAYGIAKLAQTLHALAAARAGQDITVARLFNPIGWDMPEGLAFVDFAVRIASGNGRLFTGNIDTERDFMPVSAAARVLLDIAACEGARGRIVNVCSGRPQPVRTAVEYMLSRTKMPTELVIDGSHPVGVPVIFGDTATLGALGIAPASADIRPELDALMERYDQRTAHDGLP
ncbi:MAG: NAD(P)-dependent oxidoreductase [Rhodospirillaceae bacterium]|nr:NAD(P)-dependent oxidoreductase [Rhodospirillaceae bacterium]